MNEEIELSIVMPCLNEAETLETCLRKAQGFLEQHGVSGEIVVGDNGSTDGSQEIAARCGARVIPVSTRGYGAALYYATMETRGKYVVMADSDDSYDFTALMPFLEKLREGYDLVMGNRFRGGIKPGAMPWKNKWIGNPILTAIGRLFFRCPAKDFHCGLRGFSKEAFKRFDLRTTGMEYASEMVIKATLKNLKIAEVPTTLSPDGRSRPPHLRPWRDGWRHLRFMFLYSPLWLFLVPGTALMLVGSLLGLRIIFSPLQVFGLNLDIQTLLYSAMAVWIGFQAVAFGVLSKVFAIQSGLHPPDDRIVSLRKFLNVEIGAIIGGIMLILGLGSSVMAVFDWEAQAFGNLDPEVSMRTVIPSVLLVSLGLQMMLSCFFLSVLDLDLRTYQSEEEDGQSEEEDG